MLPLTILYRGLRYKILTKFHVVGMAVNWGQLIYLTNDGMEFTSINKISSQLSLLNASSSSSNSEEFKLEDIDALVGKGDQHWFKRTSAGIFLELPQIVNSIKSLVSCEKRFREELGATLNPANGWSGPKDEKNETGKFISVYSVMHVIVKFCKHKSKFFKEHIINDSGPYRLNTKIAEIQEEHHQTMQQGYNQIKALQFENISLQGQIQAKPQEIAALEICYMKRE